ncbi:MAG: MMPL family transporter [Alphaproteobacteria bacterium]|nr:MMPL family transporter [Alphaproteobacteria bacterium]
MVETLARLLVRRSVAWAVVIASLVIGAVCGVLAVNVPQDDDVLAFLPPDNPDIQAFRRINERFGSTDIALVGIATDDPFAPDFVARMQALSTDLRDTPGLDSALTLTNVTDFVEDPDGGGIVTSELIQAPPADAAEEAALRDKVMSRDHIVGTFVSDDAKAVLVYAFGAPGQQPRAIADRVRAKVDEHFPDAKKYWGGGPFISTWIYETTQADMAALTPWAIVAIIVIMMAAFRDVLGTVLGLLATAIGIAVSRAAMAVLGVSFNIVLSSMPIILFAIGSAYAIHILSHYDHHARKVGENPEAVVRTLVGTGPTVVTAGLTTAAGLLSFVMMDIEPMRTFGVFTAVGIFVALVTSLTFVPAVIALYPRPVRGSGSSFLEAPMVALAGLARNRRLPMLVAVMLIAVVGLGLAGRVQTRMDLRAFFDQGTEPDIAQTFLDEHFGGSQFIQIDVRGDLTDPEVLREIGRIGDRIALLPHVTDVRGIDDVMAIINEAMAGTRRVPDSPGQTGVLYRFLASDPAVKQLVTDDRTEALVQVKLGTSDADLLDDILDQVEQIVREEAITSYTIVQASDDAAAVAARAHDEIRTRVIALAHTYEVPLPDDAGARIDAFLAGTLPTAPADAVAGDVVAFLTSDECFVELSPDQADAVAHAATALGPAPDADTLAAALATALAVPPDDGTVQDLLVVLDQPLVDAWRAGDATVVGRALLDAAGAQVPATPKGERFVAHVAATAQDLDNPTAMIASDAPDATPLAWTVSGMPVLYRGLARSVTTNQFKSLGFALALVLLIMTVYYRSPFTGILATAPTFVTLALVYGGMGLMGVQLDIGTSMLASIIIGAGVDYAVHLLAGWDAGETNDMLVAARTAVGENAHAIWTNAIMVAAGFFVLTLGDARPLQNVGGLTASAMVIAALSTFVVVPLLANRNRYREPTALRGP